MERNGCCTIALMTAAAGESIFLPQYTERLTGLLYLHIGTGILTGSSEPPYYMAAGSTKMYPAWQPHRLDAHEDVSVLFCALSLDHANGISEQSMAGELRQALPQLNALARMTENLLCKPEVLDIPHYVQYARQIIDECYKEDLTLEEIALRVGRSKYHLSHAFRTYYHDTPGSYLISVRLAQAQKLLADTDLPVREIGQQVGFSNGAYFTTLFKRRFGIPPKDYRTLRREIAAK